MLQSSDGAYLTFAVERSRPQLPEKPAVNFHAIFQLCQLYNSLALIVKFKYLGFLRGPVKNLFNIVFTLLEVVKIEIEIEIERIQIKWSE